jgi:predicted nucleotidyltransferase
MVIDVYSRLGVPEEAIADFCRRWKITELSVFGSALRDDFRPDSDIDLLATFAPKPGWSLFDHVHMEDELELMLGRKVDLVSRRAVEASENYIRRRHILKSVEPIYVAR